MKLSFKIFFPLLSVMMPVSMYFSFIGSPAEKNLGETIRILYIHVPCAWVSVMAFAVAAFFAALHIIRGKHDYFVKSAASAAIGSLFIIIAASTGAVWAYAAWGSFWNWDPRETTVLFLIMVYGAYFALKFSAEKTPRGRKSVSAYLLAASLAMPFFIFVIPRIGFTLHPDLTSNAHQKIPLHPKMQIALFLSIASYTLLYAVLFITSVRISRSTK